MEFLTGGLGMHTGNNDKFIKKNEGNLEKGYRYYHKKGGNVKFYAPVENVLKWTKHIRSKYYDCMSNIKKNEGKKGFIISGISSELAAREMQEGAAWESNKAMGFFPKDPKKYPVEFFIGILNTPIYNKIMKMFNHTNSIQIRDIEKIPMFPFEDEDIEKISLLSRFIIEKLKVNMSYNYKSELIKINQIVKKYVDLQKEI
jgi:hypothetical protein